MYFLLNLSHYVEHCGHFCQILAFFTMPAHQIWSYHVTKEARNFFIMSYSTFNIRKSHKFSRGKALYFRSYQPKTSRGDGKHPPVPFGLNTDIENIRGKNCYIIEI